MALNVRFLQKAGVPTAEAVTGVGLNSIAGAIVHVALLVVFFAWAGQTSSSGFSIPGGSKVTVVTLFDNSTANKYNPAPEKEVFWSEQSWDEMYAPQARITVDSRGLSKAAATAPQQR